MSLVEWPTQSFVKFGFEFHEHLQSPVFKHTTDGGTYKQPFIQSADLKMEAKVQHMYVGGYN